MRSYRGDIREFAPDAGLAAEGPKNLRNEGAGTRSHRQRVAAIDEAIGIHVGTKVGGVCDLAGAVASDGGVAGVDDAVAICIAQKKANRRGDAADVAAPLIGNIAQGDRELPRLGDAAEADHIQTPIKPDPAAARHAGVARNGYPADAGEWVREVEDDGVHATPAAAFHRWYDNVEFSRSAVHLSRDDVAQAQWCQLERADVVAVASICVWDAGEINWPRDAALISRQAEGVAGIKREAASKQSERVGRSAVVL